ncbi:flavodoxin domain-containing protein, partial [Rhodoplanes elegans]
MTIVILYGTETGNAEMLAEDLADRLSADHHVKVVAMDGAGPSVFDTDALFLIVTSTYGDGELPASAKPFHAALAAARPSLAGKRFAVFGLGDSQYAETFNFGGRTFQELLESLGARAVAPRGLHDASGKELAEDVAGRWLDEVLVAAETVCPFASLLPEVRANSCPSCVTKSWAGPRVVQSWGDGILCPSGYRITPGEDGPMCTDSSSTRVMPIAAPGTAGAFPLIAAIRGGP